MTRPRHTARLSTVAFVRAGSEVLLLRHPETKARFSGLWDGIGGHVEAGEDLRGAARRELREESGLDVAGLALRGVIHESGLLGHHYVVFLFVGESERREVRSPEGLTLAWHDLAKLDALPLVEDLRYWLRPLLEAERPLVITQRYDGGDGLLSVQLDGREQRVVAPEGAET